MLFFVHEKILAYEKSDSEQHLMPPHAILQCSS